MKPPPKGWPRISAAANYVDPAAAIDWLCSAFGFEIQLKVEGEGGAIKHSELVYGGGLVMVGGETDERGARAPYRMAPPSVGGKNTQNLFVYVPDVVAHCARARAAGATIVSEPAVSDYGEDHWADRGYECVDVGGHHWWFAERLRDGPRFAPVLDSSALGPTPPPKGWPRISSSLLYAGAASAIDWLCRAYGFQVQIRVEGEGGVIEHSELVYDTGLVMVSDAPRAATKYPHRAAPGDVGGANTQSLMVYVDDARAHCAQARAAGATILDEPRIHDYGGDYWADLSYGAVDPGGHHWWFTERVRG
jgi:uncharacterized glyoxalase superfamily protein PhnB